DTEKIVAIVREIEAFYTFQENLSIRTYTEINQEELKKRETRLKEAQSLAHLGYWDFNPENNSVKWSEELYLIYGLDKKTEITAELIAKHIYPEDAAALNKQINQLYEKGGSFTQEYRIRNSKGETRILADKAYIEKDSRSEEQTSELQS